MRERMQKSQVRVNGSRPEARPELARDDLPTANLNRRCKKERRFRFYFTSAEKSGSCQFIGD